MTKELAVLVVHGIGNQAPKKEGTVFPSDKRTFSNGLYNKLKRYVGADNISKIAWREAVWAGKVQYRQQEYLKKIKSKTRGDFIRGYFLNYLADAASYQHTPNDGNDQTYDDIHKVVATAVKELEADVGADTPLLIIAHSMGGHIMSNYIYDQQNAATPHESAFQGMKKVAAMVTFGCNIPLFVFSYDGDNVKPIEDPGSALEDRFARETWWYNYYDQDDVLGYPLAEISTPYGNLADSGGLKEEAIDSGGIFTSWNPFSHSHYWKDRDIYRPIGKLMLKHLNA